MVTHYHKGLTNARVSREGKRRQKKKAKEKQATRDHRELEMRQRVRRVYLLFLKQITQED